MTIQTVTPTLFMHWVEVDECHFVNFSIDRFLWNFTIREFLANDLIDLYPVPKEQISNSLTGVILVGLLLLYVAVNDSHFINFPLCVFSMKFCLKRLFGK